MAFSFSIPKTNGKYFSPEIVRRVFTSPKMSRGEKSSGGNLGSCYIFRLLEIQLYEEFGLTD